MPTRTTSRRDFSRRDFLKITGVTLGASVVACGGLTALATHSPAVALPEAANFVNENRATLQRVPTAYFTVCATLIEDTPANRARAAGFIAPVRAMFTPAAEGYFSGKVDPNSLSFIENISLQAKGVPQGDFRDWDKITNWAQSTYAQICD
jgi:hypothetical protein